MKRDGQAVEEFIRSWKKGRGKPVDREVLKESGAVSGSFIEEVTQLAKEANGEAERIIEALRDGEVSRFRAGKMDELEQFFEENGYIKPMDPLEPEEIRIRVVEALIKSGVPREQASERVDILLDRLAA